MIKSYDVYYRVLTEEIVLMHGIPGPDEVLPYRFETKEEAQNFADKWNEEHHAEWRKAYVKKYMDEII